jgi:hypothetical protein
MAHLVYICAYFCTRCGNKWERWHDWYGIVARPSASRWAERCSRCGRGPYTPEMGKHTEGSSLNPFW